MKKANLGIFFWICILWLVLVIIAAILAPYIHLQNPNTESLVLFASPGSAHWFGTDDLGRDIFSRTVYGARVSLLIGIGSIIIGLFIGGLLGVAAAYIGGIFDGFFTVVFNVILAFPAIVLLLGVVSVFGQHLAWILLAIAVVAAPIFFRLARNLALPVVKKDFVYAAKILGASKTRIFFFEILPNISSSLLSLGFLGISAAIIAEGTLAYLGLSVHLPTPSWGNIIAESAQSRPTNQIIPYGVLFPSVAIVFTTIAFNYTGTKLQHSARVKNVKL
jgi:peptide/nickel transport system permease protein